ncbi:MAG: histidine phosphatase family protein [Rhodocyclales bacterium]|nr:histidine phosphatase family protein [Rhodocyclales bacterium]
MSEGVVAPAHVCVARHGETDWNVAGILQGWLDVPINDIGRRQAFELVAAFSQARFSLVCSSPLVRSRETAEIIARALRLPPPVCLDGLKERNFGVIQGVPKAELAELNPVLLQQIMKRNPSADFEQGETLDEFAERIFAALHFIGHHYPGQRILVVTHGWVMDAITRHVAGLPRNAILNMKRKNGETLWLEVGPSSIGRI